MATTTTSGKIAGLLVRAALQYLRKTAKRKREARTAARSAAGPAATQSTNSHYGTYFADMPVPDRGDDST